MLGIAAKSSIQMLKNDLKRLVKICVRKIAIPSETGKAKIIAIDKERLSLSMKQLVEDPWISEVEGLKKGSKVEGTVTRITPFGAFVPWSHKGCAGSAPPFAGWWALRV